MFSVNDFLDRAKAGAGLDSDYGLAKVVGVSRANVSNWRHERNAPDERAILKLCELSGDDPEHVAACIQSMRAANDDATRDAVRIARHLGVSARTLARWIATGSAPRLAHLALFWESRWGLSAAHCDAANGERVALGLARSLERECAMLRARIARLEETGDFGAANAPLYAAH